MTEVKIDLKKDYIDSLDKIIEAFSNGIDVNSITISNSYNQSLMNLFHLIRSLFSDYQECQREYESHKVFDSTEYLVSNGHLICVSDIKTLWETYVYLRGINEYYSQEIEEKYKTFLEEYEKLTLEELVKATLSVYLLSKVSTRKDLILKVLQVDCEMLNLFIGYLDFLDENKGDITVVKDGVPIFKTPELMIKYIDLNLDFNTKIFQRLMVKGVKL